MDNEKKLKMVKHGVYIFTETEERNIFYFYREDGKTLGDVGRLPMDMYQYYVCMNMFENNTQEIIASNVSFERSTDGKVIRLTTRSIGEMIPIKVERKEEKGIKRLIKSLFR